VWRTGPVAIITYEDDETEWHRRFAAACIHYEADYAYVMANVHFLRRRGGRVVFAQRSAAGGTLFPDGEAIIGHLRRIGAVLLVVDPFNHAHTMDDGNNNVLIAQVADEISRIAREANVAALVLHHLRKGSNGSLDDLMGATSLRANFRSCRILARMTPDEAEEFRIDDPWRYLRIANTKANYAPPPDKATWFALQSVPLGNAAGIYTEGDEVVVATTWEPPSPFDGIGLPAMQRIFDRLEEGAGGGWFYSRGSQAQYWAGDVIVAETGKSKKQAAKLLSMWLENDALIEVDYRTPKYNKASKVTPNKGKTAEMLAPLSRWLEARDDH
jgi:hypothetical protein